MPKVIPPFRSAPTMPAPIAAAEPRSPLAHVFVLGAGFSKAINPAMPLMTELGTRVAAEIVKRPSVQVLPEAAQKALKNGLIPAGDVEAWLSSLAIAAPFVSEAEAHYNAGVFAEIAGIIGSEIESAETETLKGPEPPQWLRKLVHLWSTVGASVITFNYDTLIEHASSSLGPTEDRWPTVAYQLLKVHGSTNWWRMRGNADSAVERAALIPGWGFAGVPREGIGSERVLVPPVAVKSAYYDTSFIRLQWQQARSALEHASSVWIGGYRLPMNDLATTTLISQYLALDAKVTVADLDPRGPATVLEQLGRSPHRLLDGPNAIQNMAEAYQDQIGHEVVPQFAEMLDGIAADTPVMVRVGYASAVQDGIGKGLRSIVSLQRVDEDLIVVANDGPLGWDDGPHSISCADLRDAIGSAPEKILVRYRGTDQVAVALSDLNAWPNGGGVHWLFIET